MYKVINKEQLIEANNIAKQLNWPRHFKSDDFSDIDRFEKKQEWPILFSIKMRKNRWRVLFEHENGELYQLDIPLTVFDKLKVLSKDERKSLQ